MTTPTPELSAKLNYQPANFEAYQERLRVQADRVIELGRKRAEQIQKRIEQANDNA